MWDRSVSWLVHELWHKTQIFPFPVFTDFVTKLVKMLRLNFFVVIEFFHHSSWMAMVKNHLKLQFLSFISLIRKNGPNSWTFRTQNISKNQNLYPNLLFNICYEIPCKPLFIMIFSLVYKAFWSSEVLRLIVWIICNPILSEN